MPWTAPLPIRTDAPTTGDERTLLDGWLEFHRQTLLRKCAGLTAEQLRTPAVEPSTLSLHGLVRHMGEVERSWFRRRLDGVDLPFLYCGEGNEDGDFDDVESADAAADLDTLSAEVAAAPEVAARYGLEDTFVHPRTHETISLRWLYLHMIEEYARHNGHADLLRERIDGVTGD
jgi:uncharacterized damage-inducible protein DinB